MWTEKCEESFQKLKQLLTTAPILKIADPYGDFVVCTNAYKEGSGGVLVQNNHVVCYESWKLKEHERNYATHKLELVAIIHALKVWRHYMLGKIFILMINNIGLKYLSDQ